MSSTSAAGTSVFFPGGSGRNSRPFASRRTSSWRSGFLPQSKTAFDVELRIILDEECYQVQESLSYTAGSHTLKFGFDFSKMDPNLNSGPNNNGCSGGR